MIRFHPEAGEEFIESAVFYESTRQGMGRQFQNAVRDALARIEAHPEIGNPIGAIRRLTVNGFPYDIVYRIAQVDVDVLALAHHRRRPGYWRRRD